MDTLGVEHRVDEGIAGIRAALCVRITLVGVIFLISLGHRRRTPCGTCSVCRSAGGSTVPSIGALTTSPSGLRVPRPPRNPTIRFAAVRRRRAAVALLQVDIVHLLEPVRRFQKVAVGI